MRNQHRLISIIFNLLFFVLFFTFFNAIYDRWEDVYVLYKLSGGFGDPPTELTHYNHLIHPLLGGLLAMLFRITQVINWYSIALIVFHYAACTIILSTLLAVKPTIRTILFYFALLVVFEGRFLASISFTNTSIILGCAGVIVLASTEKKPGLRFPYLLTIVLLLFASFFRIHVLVPVTGVVLPFLLIKSKQSALANTITLLAAGVLIVVFNLGHQFYFEKHIQGWKQEEAYRQKLYRIYNNRRLYEPRPGEKWYKEYWTIQKAVPFDTAEISSRALSELVADLNAIRPPLEETWEARRWYLINNRIMFCTLFLLILFSGRLNRQLLVAGSACLLLLITGSFILKHNTKLPDYVLLSCLLLFGLLVLLRSDTSTSRNWIAAGNILALMMAGWGIIQLHKTSPKNKLRIEALHRDFLTIQRNDKVLFIACIDFPLDSYYIFDRPEKYPFNNLLFRENFLQNDYQSTFKRFGIERKQDLYKRRNVAFFYCDSASLNLQKRGE